MELYRTFLYKIGKTLRKARLRLGLTQEEYSAKVGLHRTYLGAIERGERNISFTKACRLCKALEINLAEIFRSIPLFL